MLQTKAKAIFLDRDGVINHDTGYVHRPEQFKFIDGVLDACRHLQSLGYLLIIVSNQSGVGRGYYTQDDLNTLNKWLINQLQDAGITLSGIYTCPHLPSADGQLICDCRKPAPGMLRRAIDDHRIDPALSLMIGDKFSDVEAGDAAGVGRLVLIGNVLDPSLAEVAFPERVEFWSGLVDALVQVKD